MMRLALAAMLLATAAQAQVDIDCRWSPPDTGSTPVRYVLDLAEDGGGWALEDSVAAPDTSMIVVLSEGHYYHARVRAISASGVRGLYGYSSFPLTILTAPDIDISGGAATITSSQPDTTATRWVFQVMEDNILRHLYVARDSTATVEIIGAPDSLQVQVDAFNGERTVGVGVIGRQAR